MARHRYVWSTRNVRAALVLLVLCLRLSSSTLGRAQPSDERAPLFVVPPSRTTEEGGASATRRRAARETVAGIGIIGAGVGLSMNRSGSEALVLTTVSIGGSAAIAGTFVMMHGAARLHVARALGRGAYRDLLMATELHRGRMQMVTGGVLIVVGGLASWGGTMIGAGGPNPALAGFVYGICGGTGLSGVLLMEHAVYRVHFGHRGIGPRVALTPSVLTLRDGGLLGVRGRF